MKILSIPRLVHDSSICILEDGKIISYIMEERFSRLKHDLKFDYILNFLIEKNNTNFDKIIITKYFLDDYTYSIKKIQEKIKLLSYSELIFVDGEHHLYHSYCGFYNSQFEEAICFSLDASGAILKDGKVEIESVYYLNKKENKKENKIYKKKRKFKSIDHSAFEEYYSQISWSQLSVGEKFFTYAKKIGYNEKQDPIDAAGKIMGLAQYKNHKEKLQYPYNTKEWKERVDSAYELQQETQNHVLKLIQKYVEETGVKNVVISGGYGLNCVANYHYLKNLKDINLYIDPVCFDAGISIGTAYYHYIESTQNNLPIQPLQNAYIGYKEETYDLSGFETQKVSYDDIVNLLLQKNVVALFQGRSEAGQRALGNRSLLFDPRVSNGKDIVNQIKKRENFRPFAGTILQEEAHKWFNMLSLKESPYMQYAIDAYQNAIDQVPAIIHADNTCRIQTITQEQNHHFYNLISCFFEKTGVPMLMNTSFNLGGEPLVETFDHAIHTLKNSMIEYLYLPEIETLVTVKNKKIIYS
jgi:carbamoyltransferase